MRKKSSDVNILLFFQIYNVSFHFLMVGCNLEGDLASIPIKTFSLACQILANISVYIVNSQYYKIIKLRGLFLQYLFYLQL